LGGSPDPPPDRRLEVVSAVFHASWRELHAGADDGPAIAAAGVLDRDLGRLRDAARSAIARALAAIQDSDVS